MISINLSADVVSKDDGYHVRLVNKDTGCEITWDAAHETIEAAREQLDEVLAVMELVLNDETLH
jgi:hypothetical protein